MTNQEFVNLVNNKKTVFTEKSIAELAIAVLHNKLNYTFRKGDYAKNFPLASFISAVSAEKRKIEIFLQCEKNKISPLQFRRIETELKKIDLKKYTTEYSMGDHKYLQLLGVNVLSDSTCEEYSNSSKYNATHGSINICFNASNLREMKGFIFESIGGIDTFLQNTNDKIKKCFWIEQSGSKQHHTIKIKKGFVTAGFHAETLEACENWRNKEAKRLKMIRLFDGKSAQKFVGIQHSEKVGNCNAGTMAFAKKHNLNPKMGYTVEYLLSLEDTLYTRKLLSV